MTYKSTIVSCYMGYVTQAIVVNFMPILFAVFQDDYGISFSMLGNLVLLNFVTQIAVDMVAAKYVDRIGFRRAAVPAHIFCAAGLILLGILPSVMPPYPALVISVITFSFGGGLIEVVISPVIDAMPSDNGPASMSLLHSFYCWGQLLVVLLTTLALKIFGNGIWKLLAVFWAIVPIVNTFNFVRVPLPKTCSGKERTPISSLLKERGFVTALILMMAAGASEQNMAQWVSLFAQKGLQVSKVVGDLLGPCLFALFMAVGRMWYGMKGEKLDIRRSLLFCSISCIACYLGAVFFGNPMLSLAACALTGFAVSLMWPGLLAYTASCFPRGGAAMFGVLAVFGDIGCSLGPWIVGVVSDYSQKLPDILKIEELLGLEAEQLGLKLGILAGIIFPIIMIVGILKLRRHKIQ